MKSDEGNYFCRISNTNGSTDSTPTFVNVLSKSEYASTQIFPNFAKLDLSANGELSFNEVGTFVSAKIARMSRGAGPLTMDEFDEIDTDGNGELSIPEVLAAADIPMEFIRYEVTPTSHAYPDIDIDEGATDSQTFVITNFEAETLDLFTTPTLVNEAAAEFNIVDGSGENRLNIFDQKVLTIDSDPAKLNERVAYLEVRTDDFLVPVFPVLLSGFGFQTTGELVDTLMARDGGGRSLEELDVNEDKLFDGADIDANTLNGF